jgi:hypothetical protein
MSVVGRVARVLPVAAATVAATALAGVAVFTVSNAGCADPGRYVQRDGHVELVGGCVDSQDLPQLPAVANNNHVPVQPASTPLGGVDRLQQARP